MHCVGSRGDKGGCCQGFALGCCVVQAAVEVGDSYVC